MADVEFDFARPRRTGLAEAVLAIGKSPAQLAEVIRLAHDRGVPLLLTRLGPEAHAALLDRDLPALDYDPPSRTAFVGEVPVVQGAARVAVVTAGTSDLAVAGEAIRTLAFNGIPAERFPDCGVAGLWRLLRHEDALRRFPVLIACAGMEGALFSVLGGLVGGVIIAVPTSTGYGVAEGGRTALHAALASCAPGIVTVNVDNGYGAATAAIRVLSAGVRA
jgi:NCAIR mutase (PurE)-related protein